MKNFFLLAISVLVFSCSTDDYSDPNPEPNVLNSVRLRSDTTFGNVLTDTDGFTLYFFAPDAKGEANCLGGCANAWPSFFAENLTLDAGLNSADFSSITRTDGQSQTTYKGWPLYKFSNDNEAGQINGDGANGVWFVAKPDYSVMLVRSQLVGRDSNGNETNLNSAFEPGDEQTFYITDDWGNTLYHFSNDENGNNNFTASDFSNNAVWPIFHTQLQKVPSALNSNGFGTIDVFGEPQLTYKGWPLYNFGGDNNRGDNFGVGFPVAGVWPILNLDTEIAPQEVNQPDQIFEVTNVGASAYLFDFTTVENPELELTRGKTYEFNVNSPGHPFYIKSIESTGTNNAFNNGVTNNGTSNGTLMFTVPNNAPDILFYNCEFHGSMTGRIRIVDEDDTRSFQVGNNGATSYVFSGDGFNTVENANFTFKRGKTYTFNVTTPGHPFIIKSVQGTGTGNAYNNGVTNNGASADLITFQVPQNAPDTLFYNCEFHGSMTGIITIID
ncbi:hypothetical protein [Lacinutrix sp. Hel_I_90]|uniref:hypothetical protein n=1 Tax=Lacinutrix sp. Hel_I_90 TaxID=1249999 RepID=UPI000B2DB66C|nr:hypothetical protein [Lacinutrix sp. Hel_I_90]